MSTTCARDSSRLRLPDVPGQCALRRRLSARHLGRPAADPRARSRSRARPAPMRSATARPARATTRSASAQLLCAGAQSAGDRALAGMGVQEPRRAPRLRGEEPDQVAKDKRGKAPFSVDANLLHTSSEGKLLEDPAQPSRTMCSSAPPIRSRRQIPADRRDRLRARRSGLGGRPAACHRPPC